ncbi:MAG: response regulator, partial [Alphaproteobacteria bacterium]
MPLVVIVDDRITNRRILSKLATTLEAGTTVRDFAEPPAALAWLRQNTPDLVVTDFNMPGMNGAEFTQAIRREPSLANVPVVVVTAYEDKSYRYQALEAGATDFLLSPVDHHEFRSRCRNLLTLERQRRQLKERAELLERKLMRDSEAHAAALQQSHQRLLRVIDAVPAMISATDNAGRVVFMNSFEAQLLGTTPDEAAGRTPADIDPHGYGTRSLALDRMIFDLGEAPAPFDETISFNGDDRTFHLTKMALRDGA